MKRFRTLTLSLHGRGPHRVAGAQREVVVDLSMVSAISPFAPDGACLWLPGHVVHVQTDVEALLRDWESVRSIPPPAGRR